MKPRDANEKLYGDFIDNLNSRIPTFNLENYFDSFYEGKTPFYLRKYFEPERKYFKGLARELNPYVEEIRENFCNSLRKNPKEVMSTKLEDLLFLSGEFKDKFGKKIGETLEEASYAGEIASVEGYKIWNVKYNLPIIGRITRRKLRQKIGLDDLPSFAYIKDKIREVKSQAYSFLDYLGFNYSPNLSKSEIRERYHQRMRRNGYENRRLLEYDYNEKRHLPLNAKESEDEFREEIKKEYSQLGVVSGGENFEKYYKSRKKERRKEFVESKYNSFGERLVCYVGMFFNWLFGK